MPIYEYKCSKCNQTFEAMRSFSDAPLGTHPGCGGEVTKLLSAPSIIFKGSGFHVNDYRKDSAQSGTPSTPSSAKPSSKKTDKKTNKKTETKSETLSKSSPKPTSSSEKK